MIHTSDTINCNRNYKGRAFYSIIRVGSVVSRAFASNEGFLGNSRLFVSVYICDGVCVHLQAWSPQETLQLCSVTKV